VLRLGTIAAFAGGLLRIHPTAQVSQGAPLDPNWLLSTSAVAAATLLAIVGGLFVAQLISLVSEQHAADARLTDAREALKEARRNLSRATDTLRAAATRLLLHDRQLASFVAVRGAIPAEEAEQYTDTADILAQLLGDDRRECVLKAVEMLAEMRVSALDALICFVPVTDLPEPWERIGGRHFGVFAEAETQWRAVYNLIAAHRAIEATEMRGHSSADSSVAEVLQNRFPDDVRSRDAASGPESFLGGADTLEALSEQARAVENANTALAVVAAAKQHRNGLIPPAEFRSGVWVLMYLAIAVILPLAILASGPRYFSFTITYLVPGSLGIGVIVLVIFFWRLSRTANRQAIPPDGEE